MAPPSVLTGPWGGYLLLVAEGVEEVGEEVEDEGGLPAHRRQVVGRQHRVLHRRAGRGEGGEGHVVGGGALSVDPLGAC